MTFGFDVVPQQVELFQVVEQVDPMPRIECVLPGLVLMVMPAYALSALTVSVTICDVRAPSDWTAPAPVVVAGGLLELVSSLPRTSFCWLLAKAFSTWVSSAGRLPLTEIP